MNTIETIDNSPFRHLIMTIGNLPTSFTESMTYYEMLAWLCNFIEKTVIPAVNNNASALKELQDAFVELKGYVDNYFENLDVQTEINNKLDQMALDGTLQAIMADYLNANVTWTFDTLADMKESETLTDGGYARTIGYATKNDNGGCLYYIRTRQPSDKPNESTLVAVGDSLVAELVYTEDFLPISYTYVRYQGSADRKTDVWYSIIPAQFHPELFVANNTIGTIQEPSENASDNLTTLTINAGVGTGVDYADPIGVVIKDGEVLQDNSGNTDDHAVIYMNEDGELGTLPGSSTTATILAENPNWAVCGWWPIIADGEDYSGDHDPTDYKPRTWIGQNAGGDYIVCVCAGRQYANPGLSAVDMKTFVTSVGFTPTFLYSLDGGGSSCMLNRCKRVNKLDNFENRSCPNYIGFRSKHAKNRTPFEAASMANKVDIERQQNLNPEDHRGYTSVPEAVSSQVTIDPNSQFLTIGNMAIMNIGLTTSAETAKYTKILEGLPPTAKTYIWCEAFNAAGNVYPMYFNPQGELHVGSGLALPAGTYNLNVVYRVKYNP